MAAVTCAAAVGHLFLRAGPRALLEVDRVPEGHREPAAAWRHRSARGRPARGCRGTTPARPGHRSPARGTPRPHARLAISPAPRAPSGKTPTARPVLAAPAGPCGSRAGRRAPGRAGSGRRRAGTHRAARRTSPAWSARAPVAASRSRAAARRASRRGWPPSPPLRSGGPVDSPYFSSRQQASAPAAGPPGARGRRTRVLERPDLVAAASTSATTCSTTSSRVYGVVSRCTAPSGATARRDGPAGVDRVAAQQVGLGGLDVAPRRSPPYDGRRGPTGRRSGRPSRRPGARRPSRCRGPRRRCHRPPGRPR